jgi:hypothetical protein
VGIKLHFQMPGDSITWTDYPVHTLIKKGKPGCGIVPMNTQGTKISHNLYINASGCQKSDEGCPAVCNMNYVNVSLNQYFPDPSNILNKRKISEIYVNYFDT